MTDLQINRMRMHGLYLSRLCGDITELASQLLGLHCWFHRNVCFSALIRGADLTGWKTALTKTWLFRGTLHGVCEDDLPTLLALHSDETYLDQWFGKEFIEDFADEVLRYLNDGVYSRTEFRQIFLEENYDPKVLDALFSSWGGIFVRLARQGRVAFRDMTSRDFDLISAEPTQTRDEVLPELFRRYIAAYGPATLADASWFFGLWKDDVKELGRLPLDEYSTFERDKKVYYYLDSGDTADIPELTMLSGFDPLVVSYVDRSAVLDNEYKSRVVLKSGICLPTIAVNGRIAGLWNIKNGEPTVEFFASQPKRLINEAAERAEWIGRRVR